MSEDQCSVTETVAAAVRAVPYAAFLGVEVAFNGDEITAILPYAPHLIGNPLLPAIHGGVLGAFMELTAIAQLSVLHPHSRQPRSISEIRRADTGATRRPSRTARDGGAVTRSVLRPRRNGARLSTPRNRAGR